MLNRKQIAEEITTVADRIQKYLRLYEIDRAKSGIIPIPFTTEHSVYLQQFAKLTAYLYFLDLLGYSRYSESIRKERGRTIVNETAGVFEDKPKYLKKYEGSK